MIRKEKSKIREPLGDRVLQKFTTAVLIFVILLVSYPILYVIASSFSDSAALTAGRVTVLPMVYDKETAAYTLGIDMAGYKFVFAYDEVWKGFRNSIFYTITGTCISLTLIVLMAYPLSKAEYQGRKVISKLLLVAMLISAGLVPVYLLKTKLGINGTIWAVVLAGALNINNIFIMRTSFKSSIPGELFDAAKLDGANDFQCLVRIAIPLAKATISVLVLYAAVRYWNDYFNAMLYLQDRRDLWPLQLVLRNFLLSTQTMSSGGMSAEQQDAFAKSGIHQIQFCLIVVATVPVLALYSVVQKYFEKGVMIGSVKG